MAERAIAAAAAVQAKAMAGPGGQRAPRQVVQRFESNEQAAEKGTELRTLSAQEFALNVEITTLVQAFQTRPTEAAHVAMMAQIDEKRAAITELHQRLAAIVALYEAAPDGQQGAFFNAYLADKPQAYGGSGDDPDMNHGEIRALFDSIAGKTDAVNAAGDDEPPDLRTAERGRFLTFVLQGLHDDMGADQYRNLNRLLGDNRRIKIDRVGPNNLSAGLANADHNQYGNKIDNGATDQDAQLLQQGGSGLEFLRRKFQNGYDRTANDQRDQIGDVQVNMDRDDLLTPIFAGMAGDEMRLFAAPKKFTVHHEIGHVISALEGKSGSGRAMGVGLANLSDQEEMHNIWGGPRSDRAYGEAMGLPQRFDHRSLVTYYGGGGGDYQDFTETLKSGYRFTTTLDQARALVLAEVRRLLDGNWGGITKGIWSAPDGVKALRKLFPGPPTVAQVRDTAAQYGANAGSNRNAFTTAFYQTLAQLAPDDKAALINSYLELKKMTVPAQ